MNFNPYLHSSGGNFRSWRRAALEGRFLRKCMYMVYFRSFFSVFVCLVGTRIHDIFLHTIHIRDKKNKQIKKSLSSLQKQHCVQTLPCFYSFCGNWTASKWDSERMTAKLICRISSHIVLWKDGVLLLNLS